MRLSRKYLVAVALLAVLAVVFGLAGTTATVSKPVSLQSSSSSDSVTHFANPPTYDSEWVNITDKRGQCFNLTHDLDTTEAFVDVVGRQSLAGADHKLLFGATTYVQGFNQTYGGTWGTGQDVPSSVVQTADGGYAMAGYTGGGTVISDFWLVKVDSSGNMEWNKTYGGTDTDYALSVVHTDDGGYAIAGLTSSFDIGGGDVWLVKTDSAGNIEWSRTYGGSEYDSASCVIQTVDGGYAIAGVTESFGAGGFDFWLVKTYKDGNVQWNRTYGGTNTNEDAISMIQTNDRGYAILGRITGVGIDDFCLVKTDGELGSSKGLSITNFNNSTVILYRGCADPYWNYVRVRIWIIKEPTWQFGDINMDGVVDINDLLILGQNYGKTLSILSLTGIIAIAGIHTYKKRKQPE